MRGTPEQFEEAVKAKIAELGGYQDVESSEDIYEYDEFDDDEFASNYDDEKQFIVEDESMGELGEVLTYADLRDIFYNSKGDPVIDGYEGDFNLWLNDTVNSGYLSVQEPWGVDASAKISSVEAITADEDVDDDYFDELLDELNAAPRLREYEFDLFPGDNSVTLNVGYDDEDGNNTIVALDIPYSDLSLDFGGIDDDVRYITRYIQRELR